MKAVSLKLESLSPVAQSMYHNTPKISGESAEAWEERTWRNKAHVDDTGIVYVPPMAIAGCIKEAAKFLNRKIPGQRNATWTKHFDSGVLVLTPMTLGVNISEVRKHPVFCSADGRVGGGSKVMRFFPTVDKWTGEIEVTILDDLIHKEIFTEVINTAGSLIGLGAFRVRNRGYYGRFKVTNMVWRE